MNSQNIFSNTRFLLSGFSLKDLPEDQGIEIAFCGRSNSGKSSVLNALARNKKLAKTSKTPGRTQAINIFSLDDQKMRRIADLPGYGFAKVSKKTQKEWAGFINDYLNFRKSLRGLVIIMDIRHPFKESDLTLIDWCHKTNTALLILLNKSDKLSKGRVKEEVKKANSTIKEMNLIGEAIAFSSKNSIGLEVLTDFLGDWLEA
jgi:GTP-binding protein